VRVCADEFDRSARSDGMTQGTDHSVKEKP
jgi:hypothetical protein